MNLPENPRVVKSLPEQPVTEKAVRALEESDKVAWASSFPGEDAVQGILLAKQNGFVVVVFDRRDEVWRKLTTFSKDEHSMPVVLQEAVQARTEWLTETGRLDDIL